MKKINVICFGGEDWWYHNRGHVDMQLMRRFAKIGITLYVNSIVMQKPRLVQGSGFFDKVVRKTKSILKGLKKTDAGFWAYSPFTLPVNHLAWAKQLNEMLLRRQICHVVRKLHLSNPIIWVACPAACDVAIKMRKDLLVYQRTDRYEEYPNVDPDIIREFDQKLKASADLTLFVNSSLYKEERSQCKNAFYLDHGVDFDMFAMAEQNQYKPKDIAGIPKPIVGFFGAIDDHTSDIAFVEKVVDLLPQMSFVFIGKTSLDTTALQKRKNVWLMGYKPYELIPHYGKCFDVAIMPWRQNRWIEACNPIKLKEYLALGKPIVSTPFTELKKYREVIYEADTPEKFAQCIEQALAENNSERIIARRRKVQNATWDNKARLILQELSSINGNFSVKEVITQHKKSLRICLAASAGGHISQLLKLAESWNGYETFCVTTTDIMQHKLKQYGKVYVVGECNRQHLFKVAKVFSRCLKIALRKRPDVVISTGAAVGCIMCFLGKIIRAKVVWLDSITNVEKLSLSGRMVRYIADLSLVQWPNLVEQYKNVEHIGAVI